MTGDEMFSDAFPMYALSFCLLLLLLMSRQSKLVDDIVYEVDCQLVTVKKGANFDIGQFLSSCSLVDLRKISKVPTLPRRNKRMHWTMTLSRSTMSCIRSAYKQPLLTRLPSSNT